MINYDYFFVPISQSIGIIRGNNESYKNYLARLIYSICGRLALASLWDNYSEEEYEYESTESISITRFKRRIETTLNSYIEIVPEIKDVFSDSIEDIKTEILDIYMKTGFFYHTPKRIIPCNDCVCQADRFYLFRGSFLDKDLKMSGLGFYSNESYDLEYNKNISETFNLSTHKLDEYIKYLISDANWVKANSLNEYEFLVTDLKINNKYWINYPIKLSYPSLMRSIEKGKRIYYLYYFKGNEAYISRLPSWRTTAEEYLAISNSILFSYSNLPPIKYRNEGNLVDINLKYLLPPAEMNFLKLYSWPRYMNNVSKSKFHRTTNPVLFRIIKSHLKNLGYKFMGE